MKYLSLVSLVMTSLACAQDFRGEFSQINSTGPECDAVFQSTQYVARHVLSGPTYHTSVLHFSDSVPSGTPGFFHGLTLIGLLGYSGDIQADRTVEKGGSTYAIFSEGFVGPRFLFTKVTVDKLNGEQVTCRASGEFSSFPR